MNTMLMSGAAAALLAGIILYFKSDKKRQENGEWSSGLEYAYILTAVGVFAALSLFMSFTAVFLIFVVLCGTAWGVYKYRLKTHPEISESSHFGDYFGSFFPTVLVLFLIRSFIAEPFQIPSSSMRPGLIKGDFILVGKFSYGLRVPVLNNVFIPTGKIERSDVVVFNYPLQPEMTYIKRIVGIPGDIVEYRDKVLTVNGKPASDIPDGTYRYPDDTDPSEIHNTDMFRSGLDGKSFNILKKEGQPAVSLPVLGKYTSDIMSENGYSIDQSGLNHCQYADDGSGFVCKVPEGRYFAMGDNRDNSADSRYWGFVDDKLVVGKAMFILMNFGDFGRAGTAIR
ncbi:signal peptidase I [Neisseria gonorrhoeae]